MVQAMVDIFEVYPVGVIRKGGERVFIEIFKEYEDALFGLTQFSHIIVFSWFHKNDIPERRRILKVHPKRDRKNPLTGVFATRSPTRPNPIAISTCNILSITENIIYIDKIDAFDGTPVIDIKPCLSGNEAGMNIKVPQWV